MAKHTATWWIGQAVALTVCIGISRDFGGPIGAAVGYALAVLVDIRDAVERGGANG